MNAELRRNLWLELSTHRLIATPIAIGLPVYVLTAARDKPAFLYAALMVAVAMLLPMLLNAIGATTVADFVLPPFWAKPGLASVLAAVQAGVALALVGWRWRKYDRNR